MNIYELPKQIEQALDLYYACFDEETGELKVSEEELKNATEQLGDLQNRKDELLTWYLQDRANKLAENAGLQQEIDRLSKRVKINNKKIERVENIVDYNFKELYKDKAIEFGNFTVNYRKSEAIIFKNEDLIPEKFKKTVVTESIKIDKNTIKKAIKEGEVVEGVELEIRNNLQIK